MLEKSYTDDDEIIKAITEGDKKIYIFLIKKYKALAYSIVSGMHNRTGEYNHDVLTILHDSIIELKNRVEDENYKYNHSITSFLSIVMKRKWIDEIRRRTKIKINLYEPSSIELANAILYQSGFESKKEPKEVKAIFLRLKNCIDSLEDRERAIIKLRFFENATRKEAAKKLKMKIDNFKYHSQSCMRKLRNCMKNNQ